MRIVCPYAGPVRPAVQDAIRRFAPTTAFVEMNGLFGYAELFLRNWTGQDDFVIIEHDIVIHESVVPSFLGCPEMWCTYSYPALGGRLEASRSLGCTKFSAELQRMIHPSEFIFADNRTDWALCECRGAGCWRELDVRLDRALSKRYAFDVHVHGRVTHMHEYKSVPPSEAWRLPDDPETLAGPHWRAS